MNDEASKYVQNLLGLIWEYFLQKFEDCDELHMVGNACLPTRASSEDMSGSITIEIASWSRR